MTSTGTNFIDVNSRFFIAKNKQAVYEFSRYAERLGAAFVERACQAVRDQRVVAEVTEKTWLDNYVIRLACFFAALEAYQETAGADHPHSIEQFNHEHWSHFASWFGNLIRSNTLAPRTKSKLIFTSNKLFSILAFANVMPVKIELERLFPRKQPRDGESRFAQTGWRKTPKSLPSLSPFEIRIEKHGRTYDYTPYRQLGARFLLSAVPVLSSFYEKYSSGTAKKLHNSLISFFQYLDSQLDTGSNSDFFASLQSDNYRSVADHQWEGLLYQWRDMVHHSGGATERRTLTTSNNVILCMARIWNRLAGAGIVPEVQIIGLKNAKKRGASVPRRSLAQLTADTSKTNKAEHALWLRLRRTINESEHVEAHEFLRALCATIPATAIGELTTDALIGKIYELNGTRLKNLRECAERDFCYWYDHWNRGQAALAAVTHTADDLVQLLDSQSLSVSVRRRSSAKLLFHGPDDVRLGNALLYVLGTQNGTSFGLQGRYHHMMRSFGGSKTFHAYLHPHPDATLALWVLLLVDTGANCEVVREMPWDCLRPSTQAGNRQIRLATKLRSGGKAVFDELAEAPASGQRLSAIQAIEQYQRMAERFRLLADANSQDFLLLQARDGSVHGLTEWTARGRFIAFLSRHSALRGLYALPSMIRPSVLMDIQHKNDDTVVAAQVMADHTRSSTTLAHYTGRTPLKLKYNLLIQEFQERFQAVMIVSIEGAASKLGLTDDEMRRILSDAARTGLGVACLNSLAGIQPGTRPSENCTRLDACWKCDMRWVVATPHNVADLILFNEYLRESQDDCERQNPDAWEARWLPWLIFSDIALDKMAHGETATLFADAKARAAAHRPSYQAFPLV